MVAINVRCIENIVWYQSPIWTGPELECGT